ncbi:tripartite tricarboxylate transporter TctB family protein [Methylobacterium durans]|uniref:Tripartite tricarboxylate transporter TctB family protein n=1 Tax=Methylobacterium durans TaxID=2202825 RepID=A0A2U8W1Q1_9HYPH|nr:tripartite tricarboxylate transporter TctB family protein [Methylobacterium durans]AWN39995.1 tripartite tricarboxylate transporter TctB family protein [Methylobacterium durans]
MSELNHGRGPGRGIVRAPQSLVSGLGLVALALFGLWAGSDLPQGTLRAMGPGLMPRWLSIGIGLCGISLLVAAFLKDGEPLASAAWRGPVVVTLAILAFAVTIRPFSLGPVSTPGLGLIVAGPLAVIVGGYASPEARLRELLILALFLTAGCMLLFGDLLNLPIPIFPIALVDALSGTLSSRTLLRLAAGLLAIGGLALLLVGRGQRRPAVDVASHSMTT